MRTTATSRAEYQLLSNRTPNAVEHHYCSAKIEVSEAIDPQLRERKLDKYSSVFTAFFSILQIMDPETYGSSLTSGPATSSITIPISSAPSATSSHTINYETRSTSRRHHHHNGKKRANDGNGPSNALDNQDERIEVKILHQDDNWGETTMTTCHGGNEDTLTNTNDTSLQLNDNHHAEHCPPSSSKLHRRKSPLTMSYFLLYLLCLIALISPLFFLSLPYILVPPDSIAIDDYSPLLTIIFKLNFLLLAAFLLLYRRRTTAHWPRVHLHKLCLTIILLAIVLAYWLYYVLKLLQPKVEKYERILSFTSTYEDLLLFLLVIAVLVLEVKWFYPKWIVKVVRSPDGQTRQYNIGKILLSILIGHSSSL